MMWKARSILVGIVLILITLGIVMLASTSAVQGQIRYDDPHYFLKHQLIWLALATLASVVVSRIDYSILRKLAVPLLIFSFVLLVLVLIPGVGHKVKGSSRWLKLGPLNFQPSELAKITTLIWLAGWMSHIRRKAQDFKKGLLIPLAGLGVTLILIFVEPDFGTTMLIAVVGMAIMFIGGTQIGYLFISALLGSICFIAAILESPERLRRIIAFLNPEKYAQNEAFQLLNAIKAFVIGGSKGVGLGQSMQKRFYLPEAHTDFIFAIIGEELGPIASMIVVALFLGFFICGLYISTHTSDLFARLLGMGITMIITFQAAINIGVVTGSLPTKGLALPFISFGGSSLVMTMVMVGILINISMRETQTLGNKKL
ncbi:MAG: putative lipid II flippase FtsW [Kiritimatiellae bacterium]|nr:putative lipid II flippase FtsW [Kiritimatiellia bacterium]